MSCRFYSTTQVSVFPVLESPKEFLEDWAKGKILGDLTASNQMNCIPKLKIQKISYPE
uniref:Uncharacterized protein n=1 Tax=Moniliophthora roreri TaxID=221103 RepID=A0A0W0EZ51_MONRR